MAASAVVGLLLLDWQTPAAIRHVAFYFAIGGLFAYPVAVPLAAWLARHRAAETAFAAHLLLLGGGTLGLTAFLYALDLRAYFAEWHEPAFTRIWAYQFVFTVLGALYQFAVLGVRLFLPVGFPALLLFSLWHARTRR